jgi:hypothetical protein
MVPTAFGSDDEIGIYPRLNFYFLFGGQVLTRKG